MKKSLLLMSAALVFALTAGAQQVERMTKEQLKKQTVEKNLAPQTKELRTAKSSAVAAAPRRSQATGMYYKRPKGTFYDTFTSSSNNEYCYLVFPNFVEVTYQNMTDSAKRADTKWWWSKNDVNTEDGAAEADENNDLTTTYAIPSGRLYYTPALSLGEETFTIGEGYNFAQVGVISTDTVMSFTKWDLVQGGRYTGYQGGAYGFGTDVTTFDFDRDGVKEEVIGDAVVEFFEKPAAPLYLSSITLMLITNQTEAIKALPDTASLYVSVVKVEDGKLGEAIAEMEYTSEQFAEDFNAFSDGDGGYAFADIANVEIDAFGSEIETPMIITDEFAIIISGFSQEGVDLGLFFGNAGEASYDWEDMDPTYEAYYDANDNSYKGMLSSYGKTSTGATICYNAVIYLNGMFDVIQLGEGYDKFVAPVEGGIAETVAEFENSQTGEKFHDNVVELYTSLPWEDEDLGEENYFIVVGTGDETTDELPAWLKWTGLSTDYYADYMVNLLQFTAEALPEGETGRYAQIRIISDKGADSGVITIAQGDVDWDKLAINSVKANSQTTDDAIYSLTGQKVQKAGKGLYIKNGHKFISK